MRALLSTLSRAYNNQPFLRISLITHPVVLSVDWAVDSFLLRSKIPIPARFEFVRHIFSAFLFTVPNWIFCLLWRQPQQTRMSQTWRGTMHGMFLQISPNGLVILSALLVLVLLLSVFDSLQRLPYQFSITYFFPLSDSCEYLILQR